MNSPIVLVIAWFVINLVMKSAKEKKKIEEAKRRRESQLGGKTPDVKSTVDTSRETLRKELQRAMTAKTIKPATPKTPERQIPQQRPLREVVKPRETMNWKIEQEEIKEKLKTISEPMKDNGVKINLKRDLVRGIIFAEILSPPKGLTNNKRSI